MIDSASLNAVKQTTARIKLRDLMDSSDGWGHQQGRQVHEHLLDRLKGHPGQRVFAVSLEGVRRTDASFPRESVVEVARRYRGDKGFCLVDCDDEDLLDNWDAAALKREQPLLVWMRSGHHRLLGPQPKAGLADLLGFILEKGTITASEAATRFKWKINNASMKLKHLVEGGYALRQDVTASSGGIEFTYFCIR